MQNVIIFIISWVILGSIATARLLHYGYSAEKIRTAVFVTGFALATLVTFIPSP